LTGWLVAFLAVGLLSLWRAVDLRTGALELIKWAQVLAVAVLAYDRLVSPTGAIVASRRRCLLIAGVVGAAVLQSAVGLWQFGLRGDGVAQFVINDRFYRAYGSFQQPNPYAGFVALLGALAGGIALGGLDRVRRAWRGRRLALAGRHIAEVVPWLLLPAAATGIAAFLAAGVVASWSRGGWMGFAAAWLAMLVLLPRKTLVAGLVLVALAAAAGAVVAAGRLPPSIADRLLGFTTYLTFADVRGVGITDANFSVIERMAHWQAALGMWRERFWLGVGLGCYEPAYSAYRLMNWELPLGHAHNFYLNLLAETGLLGLVTYLVWQVAVILNLLRARNHTAGWARGLVLGLIGAWTHLGVHSLVDNLLVNNVHLHVGVLLALGGWVIQRARIVSGDVHTEQDSELRTP
jgi:O-antigen ligase